MIRPSQEWKEGEGLNVQKLSIHLVPSWPQTAGQATTQVHAHLCTHNPKHCSPDK
jgi:hypothetical protein